MAAVRLLLRMFLQSEPASIHINPHIVARDELPGANDAEGSVWSTRLTPHVLATDIRVADDFSESGIVGVGFSCTARTPTPPGIILMVALLIVTTQSAFPHFASRVSARTPALRMSFSSPPRSRTERFPGQFAASNPTVQLLSPRPYYR
jgi:hypothetical protein